MSNSVKNFQKSRFWWKFLKISILAKIVEKSHIWSKLSKILDFGQNLKKIMILVKILENVYFSQNYRKDFDFSQNLKKILILVKI